MALPMHRHGRCDDDDDVYAAADTSGMEMVSAGSVTSFVRKLFQMVQGECDSIVGFVAGETNSVLTFLFTLTRQPETTRTQHASGSNRGTHGRTERRAGGLLVVLLPRVALRLLGFYRMPGLLCPISSVPFMI